MAFGKYYSRINWRNRPSTSTALGATNLNHMDAAINEMDDRIISLDASKLNIATANSMLKSLSVDVHTGLIRAVQLDGTTMTWDLNLEKIPVALRLTEDAVLIMDTDDGQHFEADLKGLIDTYLFEDTETIGFTQTNTADGKQVQAVVKSGSIKESHLDAVIMSEIRESVLDASESATDSLTYSKDSKRYAVGGVIEGDGEDNARFYCQQAQNYADLAQQVSEINYPNLYIDTVTGELHTGVGQGISFLINENGELVSEVTV